MTKVRFLVKLGFAKKVRYQNTLSRRKTLKPNAELGLRKKSMAGNF